ncbi:MAG: dicarboxylate/amino acid:cation symporter, partial [Edaphobacter sp.]
MPKTKWEQGLLLAAAVLLAGGIALGLSHGAGMHSSAAVLRWVAIALFSIDAWRRRSLTAWIFVSMIAGAEIGFDAPAFAIGLRVFSDIFLRLIKTIVAPLILAVLITGIAGHGDLKSVGRIGLKSLIFFEIATTIGLVIGLVAINISRAGVGLSLAAAPSSSAIIAPVAPAPHWQDFLLRAFPENIAKSVVDDQILQVAIFAIFFGIALACLTSEKRAPMLSFLTSLSETMFKFTNIVMYFAPIGVGAAMAFTVGQMGLGVLFNLGKLLLTLYVALIVFTLLVLLPSALLFRVSLRSFLAAAAECTTIAFATSSSEAALPSAMESMEAYGVPRRIVAFVIPAGYSFNSTGSTLYLAIASIFVAQAAGIHLSLGEQVFMM